LWWIGRRSPLCLGRAEHEQALRLAIIVIDSAGCEPGGCIVLRRWQPGDLDSFAALNSDPEVMRHFPSTYDRSATAAMITAWEAKIDRQGFGLRAVERAEDGALLGMAGLNPVPPGIITGEGLEIGWRLARHAWGHGYATEAGRAAVDLARRIGAQSVWSFTAVGNQRSQAVMRRLGLSFVRYFDHPKYPRRA